MTSNFHIEALFYVRLQAQEVLENKTIYFELDYIYHSQVQMFLQLFTQNYFILFDVMCNKNDLFFSLLTGFTFSWFTSIKWIYSKIRL